MNAGSLQAILYEIRHGTFWTVLDELMHAVEGYYWRGQFHYWKWAESGPIAMKMVRFCNWSHRHLM